VEILIRYRIVLFKSNEVFAVSVLGLPGCWSQGATEQEAIDNIREARHIVMSNGQLSTASRSLPLPG
jgi:predicted RNase H-like HicB family nuclease